VLPDRGKFCNNRPEFRRIKPMPRRILMLLPSPFLALASAGLATALLILALAVPGSAQWSGRDGWIEEPDAKSLSVGQGTTHCYLDTKSVHRGSDGLVYFDESADVTRPDDIGKAGLMNDAYDCAKNLKYMCVEQGHWQNDTQSTVDASHDPALPIYRKYLCGDSDAASDVATAPSR
jgi:hypothetical protein